MNTSETLDKFLPAFHAAQASVQKAQEDAVNPHFKNRYASLGAVWGACREALSQQGLVLLQSPAIREYGTVLVSRIAHVSGQWVEGEYPIIVGKKNDAQAHGSGLTYARRYALGAMMNVITGEDDDGNMASAQPDFAANLRAATSLEELGAAWAEIPAAMKPTLAGVKDVKKAELGQPDTTPAVDDEVPEDEAHECYMLIEESETLDDLKALTGRIKKLPKVLRDDLRKAYVKKQASLTEVQA